jgi:hypothetical protein
VFSVLSSATEAGHAAARGCVGWLVGLSEKEGSYCCEWLAACSTSTSRRPVAIENLMIVRPAFISSVHFSESESVLPPTGFEATLNELERCPRR